MVYSRTVNSQVSLRQWTGMELRWFPARGQSLSSRVASSEALSLGWMRNPETLKPEFLKGSLRPSPVRWGVRGNGEMPGGQEGQLMREEGSSAQALQIPGAGGMDREAARRCSQTEDVQRCSAPLQDKAPGKTHLYFQDMGRRPLLSI